MRFTNITVLSAFVVLGLVSGCAAPEEDDEEQATAESALEVPDDCVGWFEREPNNNNPDRMFGKTCGNIGPGDIDKFEFKVNDGNAFTLALTAEAAVRMEVEAKCIPRAVAEGTNVRLHIKPKKDCTIKVRLTSNASTLYRVTRNK